MTDRHDRNGSSIPDDRPDGDDRTMADVNHEPPYPEPNDVWTRGFKRPSDVRSEE